jgi:peroxiredoxin Q/BCP
MVMPPAAGEAPLTGPVPVVDVEELRPPGDDRGPSRYEPDEPRTEIADRVASAEYSADQVRSRRTQPDAGKRWRTDSFLDETEAAFDEEDDPLTSATGQVIDVEPLPDEPPQEGDPAPDFALSDQQGEIHQLSKYRGRPVVLFFYPRDNTPGCTREACSFRDSFLDLENLGAAVFGISADSQRSHQRFAEKHELPYALLVDADHAVAEQYGAWGPKRTFGGRQKTGVRRMTFLIDESGRVRHIFRKVRPDAHAEEVVQRLERR